ncbi:SMI1/KNR4 family protein [Nonomuraea sp. PA05]|uniref:SMI1/KNR4 family protein n=1 Tax=Nonomuraea sp. PA05 TaxID=2604466 RepID=UPI0011D793BE|nr:SMI1/KNR4 family protein [Nonomuraea sp. PA05]TYB66112.1 SMI1/KNR4 family protein [Nonomuraea sp. PA05]
MINDDLVFEAVRARVEAGDYLDERVGLPGVDVDTEEGGAFTHAPDGRLQRLYWRGTPEHRAAQAAGWFAPLPPLQPASVAAVNECEALLGHPMPPLLRRCYLELGDGGFGPAHGFEPLQGVLSDHQQDWPEPWRARGESLLLLCHWGCGIASYVDCGDPSAAIWAIDPNPAPSDNFHVSLFPQHLSFAEWLHRWTEGTLRQPWLLQDAKTGEWRGATDAETGAAPEPA